MLATLLGMVTSKVTGPVALAAAVALLAWGVVERIQLASAHLQVKQAQAAVAMGKADLAICSGNLTVEKQAEAAQESAVARLEVQADQTNAALSKAASDAKSARAAAQSKAARIEAIKPSGPHDCPAVDAVILGGAS